MRHTYLIFATFLLLFSACSLLRPMDELAQEAEAALEAGDTEQAMAHYDELINTYQERSDRAPGEVYRKAGLLAYDLGDTRKSMEYLEQARNTSAADAETYATLAKAYRYIDNLSREITMLEHYVENYPDAAEYKNMQHRYFETLVESMNYVPAYELWPDLAGEPYHDEDLLSLYLQVIQALDKPEKATEYAERILDVNEDNVKALDWLAKKHFRQAEELYNREMQAYDENRTHRQYARLLEALEVVNTDLRIAMNYFKKLYDQKPTSEYARYLANIFERFQDEERARYYRERAQ